MDLEYAYSVIYTFLVMHQLVSLGILVGLTIFLWKKPWEFFGVVLVGFILLAVVYVFSMMNQGAKIGMENTHKITTKRENMLSGELDKQEN